MFNTILERTLNGIANTVRKVKEKIEYTSVADPKPAPPTDRERKEMADQHRTQFTRNGHYTG